MTIDERLDEIKKILRRLESKMAHSGMSPGQRLNISAGAANSSVVRKRWKYNERSSRRACRKWGNSMNENGGYAILIVLVGLALAVLLAMEMTDPTIDAAIDALLAVHR